MRCDGLLSNHLVLQWTLENVERIKARANGTTFLEISKTNFRPMPVLVPPPAVLHAFGEIVGPLYDRVTSNLKESRSLSALREALLPKLISGAVRLKPRPTITVASA